MSGTLMPDPWFTALDINGDPISGALANWYAAGTSTRLNTYSDILLTIPNLNPVVADTAGRIGPVYLISGSNYKLVLTTAAGVLVRTQDNIQPIPQSSADLDTQGTAGVLLPLGAAVYLSDGSGGKTAGQWFLADSANAYSSTLPFVGVVPAAIPAGTTGTIRFAGTVTVPGPLVIGSTYFVGTAGAMTATAPSLARYLGVADTLTTLVLGAGAPTSSGSLDLIQLEAFL